MLIAPSGQSLLGRAKAARDKRRPRDERAPAWDTPVCKPSRWEPTDSNCPRRRRGEKKSGGEYYRVLGEVRHPLADGRLSSRSVKSSGHALQRLPPALSH